MSGAAIIRFNGVSKSFLRNQGRALLRTHVSDLFGLAHKERFFALKGVSFQVKRGESVAVMGTNGAGKSTLLSLVAGLSNPDCGTVAVDGRVAALFELGSGFQFDLTGAENLRLNAALLGFSRKQARQLFDKIVDFSGVGEFINEPLRTYSTGMVLRLGFSVAVNMDPDILIIDEALAVGDQNFQVKCFDKIIELRDRGKTLLSVSHSVPMVQQLCDRALWLDHGELVMDGGINEVADAYVGRALPQPG